MKIHEWKEDLPEQCPPLTAIEVEILFVIGL